MEPRARLDFDPRITLPSHALFVGATQSGKTRLCLHLLSHPHLFHPKPSRILFHYDQFQEPQCSNTPWKRLPPNSLKVSPTFLCMVEKKKAKQ